MRKTNQALALILALSLMFCSETVTADASGKSLTIEEAKSLALKNNVQYSMQQHYIDQAKENYEEVIDDSSGNSSRSKNIAAKASAEISEDVAIENAALSVRKAVFNRDDMKRSSDYSVTEAFYNAIKAEYSLKNAEAELLQKKTDLETARIKYSLSLITKSTLFQAESTYENSQINHSKAVSDLQISFMKLSKSIGENLDATSCKLLTTLIAPDPKQLDMDKIKEGYLQNNSAYFNAREQYNLAQSKLQKTQEEYDDYYDKMKNSSADIRKQFDDMLYDAQKSFEEAEYNYELKLADLDATINNQYSSLVNLYESYDNQKKEYEDEKLVIEENIIKYQMGLISRSVFDTTKSEFNKLENQLNSTIMSLSLQYLNLSQYSLQQ